MAPGVPAPEVAARDVAAPDVAAPDVPAADVGPLPAESCQATVAGHGCPDLAEAIELAAARAPSPSGPALRFAAAGPQSIRSQAARRHWRGPPSRARCSGAPGGPGGAPGGAPPPAPPPTLVPAPPPPPP